jgi:hypothetical protein
VRVENFVDEELGLGVVIVTTTVVSLRLLVSLKLEEMVVRLELGLESFVVADKPTYRPQPSGY